LLTSPRLAFRAVFFIAYNSPIIITTVFAYDIITSWLCQLLSCNFASWCVRAVSAVSRFFFLRESFSTAHYQATLFFSATVQKFCCRITETNFFRSYVSFSSISFACVPYSRLNDTLQPLLQALLTSYNQLQKNHYSSTVPPFILLLLFMLCVSALANLPTPLSRRRAFYIVDTLVL